MKFYMDHGDQGPDARYEAGAEELYRTLMQKAGPGDSVKYLVFPFADHTEADWARRVSIPLEFLLKQ